MKHRQEDSDSQFDAAVPVLVGTVVVVLLVPDLGQLGRRHHVHCPRHPRASESDLQPQKYFTVHEFTQDMGRIHPYSQSHLFAHCSAMLNA